MFAPHEQKRLPRYAYIKEETAEHYARSTLKGNYNLLPFENFWKDRQCFLLEHGYILRPRYWPDWRPSWLGTTLRPAFCEDSIVLVDSQVMDGKKFKGEDLVAIKKFHKDSQELHISQFLSSTRDPHNHSITVFEVLDDPFDPGLALMIMPYLRPYNDPDFSTVGDMILFVSETLEGLAFMHRHNIAHRDIAVENIMMDAKVLYPDGHHPVRLNYTPDAIYKVTPLPRAEHAVHYFYIDFGLACLFLEGSSHYVVGDVDRDTEVPELSSDVPYDTFKVDIFTLGNLYLKEFEQKYDSMQFIHPLIECMTQRHPDQRPTADELLAQWVDICDSLDKTMFRWRLALKGESVIGRMFNNTVAVACEGISNLTKYVK